MMDSSRIWVKLMSPEETPWTVVSLEGVEYVDDLKKAIKNKKSNALKDYDADQLILKAKKSSESDKQAALLGDPRESVASVQRRFGDNFRVLASVRCQIRREDVGGGADDDFDEHGFYVGIQNTNDNSDNDTEDSDDSFPDSINTTNLISYLSKKRKRGENDNLSSRDMNNESMESNNDDSAESINILQARLVNTFGFEQMEKRCSELERAIKKMRTTCLAAKKEYKDVLGKLDQILSTNDQHKGHIGDIYKENTQLRKKIERQRAEILELSADNDKVCMCSVCMNPIENEAAVITPCHHAFCISCVDKVKCCPVCNGLKKGAIAIKFL
jgi:hypothetical protein